LRRDDGYSSDAVYSRNDNRTGNVSINSKSVQKVYSRSQTGDYVNQSEEEDEDNEEEGEEE
jgi:hypothetical protein